MVQKSVQFAGWLDGEHICATCEHELDYHTPTQACAVCGTKPKSVPLDYTSERCICLPLLAAGKIIGIVINPNCTRHTKGPR